LTFRSGAADALSEAIDPGTFSLRHPWIWSWVAD